MAILRNKEIKKLGEKEAAEKLKDLKLELIRANVTANRTNAKTKEIKRAISRLLSLSRMKKLELKINKTSIKVEEELKKK